MNLSVRDAASTLSVSEKSIYRWIKQQSIPACRVQGRYRLNRAELLEWATSRRLSVSSELVEEPEAAGPPLPSLVGALEAGEVRDRVSGADKASALPEVVRPLGLPEEVDREFLSRALLAREALASTAVGDGSAVPRVRDPVVLHIDRPAIAPCFLDRPIEYGALDGQPMHALLAVVRPTTRAHPHLMSKLSFVPRDARVRLGSRRPDSRPDLFAQVRLAEDALGVARPVLK